MKPDASTSKTNANNPDSQSVPCIFKPHRPAGELGRAKGWYYVLPFTSLMNKWTKDEWPYVGSFDVEKVDLAASKLNPCFGNPEWDDA